jgi:glycosyltransferase involved in cell wall biosynthesis
VAWADEVLVVDSGSTDRTVEIARSAGAKVLHHPWQGFGQQKNWAFERCQGEWILSLDADEEVTPCLAEEINRTLSQGTSHSAYRILRRSYYGDRFMHCWWPDWQQRLFKKGQARFETTPVHERLLVQGTTGSLSGYFDHRAVANLNEYLAKFNHYTDSEANILNDLRRQKPWKNGFIMQGLARPVKTFLEYYLWRQGFKDGLSGFYISLFSALYRFTATAKSLSTDYHPSEGR